MTILIGIIFREPNLIIWGFFTLFITSRICDLAIEGLPYVKGVYIISDHTAKIKQEIYDKLDRGVTILHDIVKEIDPDAFMILNDISDVMGYGFKSRKLNMGDSENV